MADLPLIWQPTVLYIQGAADWVWHITCYIDLGCWTTIPLHGA